MDVRLTIKQRLDELGLEQKDLAIAAGVTDSYISQLLTRKKLPPAPERTDIYAKMGKFLRLPPGKLSELAANERTDELKKRVSDPPAPLFKEIREMVLRKCAPEREKEVRAIFEARPFGELERLVTQKVLDVAKRIAKEHLESEDWLRLMVRINGRTYEETRVTLLEFLDTDIFNISMQNCAAFLEPLIDSWNIDLATFTIEIKLNKKLASGNLRKFEFVETDGQESPGETPALKEFLENAQLNANVTLEELAFLKGLRFRGKQPTPLYYYRELQNLRDPLHFRETSMAAMHKDREADAVEKQMRVHARQSAVRRWTRGKTARPRK